MASKKISEYTEVLSTGVFGDELILLADTSPAGNYKMTLDELTLYTTQGFIYESGSTIINVRETVQSVSSGSIDASLGAIVNMTLSAAGTLSISNFTSGMSLVIHINGGDTHGMTWTGVQWHGNVPVLASTHTVIIENDAGTIYGYDAQGVV